MLRSAFLILAISAGLRLSSAQAQIMTNGSFEGGSFTPDANGFMSLSPGSTAITGWTTFSDELAWIGSPNASNWPASDGNNWLELAGFLDSSPYAGVRQTLTTASGIAYHVTFDLGLDQSSPGNQGPITVRVAATGSSSQDFTYNPLGGGIQWGEFSYDFVAAGPSTDLSLLGIFTAGGNTIGLDNVQVSAVPEPSSAFCAFVGAALLFCRRSFRTHTRNASPS